MWLLLFVYLGPLIFANKSLVPYDVLYAMEPWNSEANDVKANENISGVWNINSIDALFTTIPVAEATKRQLQAGLLPIWDTNTLTGFPLGAFFSTYPINIVALTFLSSEQALRIGVVFHLLLLSLFAYLLLVSLDARPIAGVIAGIVASINGIVIFCLIAPAGLPAVAWMLGPFWCFTSFKRERNWKWTIAAGLCYGLFISTANVQLILYTSLVYGAYVLYWIVIELWHRLLRRATAYLLHSVGMVVIGILIGLPALVMVSQFKGGIDRPPIVVASVPFRAWIWTLVPYYWGDVLAPSNLAPGLPLHARVYIGVIPIALAITAALFSKKAEARVFMIFALSLIAVTLELPPFTNLFYLLMPSVYLDHTRVLFLASLLFAVCAGLGIDTLLRVKKARIFAAAVLGGLTLLMAAMLLWPTVLRVAQDFGPATALRTKSIATSLAFAVSGLVLVLVLVFVRERFAKIGAFILLALVAGDLFSTFWQYQAVFSSGLLQVTPTIQTLSKLVNAHQPRSRVYYVEGGGVWGARPQVLNYFDIPQITGYTSLPIMRYNMYTFASGARGYDGQMWRLWMDVREPRSNLLDALGAEYVLVPRGKLVEKDTQVTLLPEQPRELLVINRTQLQALPATSKAIHTLLQVPRSGRSFLLTGIALLGGSASYKLNVNGSSIDSDSLSQQSDLPFWRPLAIDLSSFAGQSIEIDFQVEAEPSCRFQWINPELRFNPDGSSLVLIDAHGLLLYHNTKAFPRTWLVHNVHTVPLNNVNAALSALTDKSTDLSKLGRLHQGVAISSLASTDKSIDLRQTAVVETDGPLHLGQPDLRDQVHIVAYEPTKVTVKVKTSQRGFLVLPDVYHPTWRAAIDMSPTILYATNVAMRGVVVPPGEHIVEFYYDERPIKLTIMAAVLVAVISMALLVFKVRRDAKNTKTRLP